MPIALVALIALNAKAMIRRSLRSTRTVRGLMFLALTAVMVAMWALMGRSASYGGGTDPETIRTVFPLWLLGICVLNLLTSAGERAIAFSPAEVDFLFPGPFTRRQVLGYKLLKSAVGAVLTAALFTLVFQRYVQSWAAGAVGIFLSLLFLQLFSMVMVLIGETVGAYADTRRRRVIAVASVVLVAVALLPVLHAGRSRSLFELAATLASSGPGVIVLAPFATFGEVVTAKHLVPDALPAVLFAGLVLATLATTLMWLDVQHLEAAARAGQKVHERIRRLRSGGVLSSRVVSGGPGAWLVIPPLPRVGGAGPIAWRQLTTAMRQSRAVITLLFVLCVALGPTLYVIGAKKHHDPVALLASIVVSMNVLFANSLRFDFRGDLAHLDVLKSLPITPLAMVLAQLVAPTLILSLCQILLFVGAAALLRLDASFLLGAGLMAAPLNALVFAIENLLFLLFPVRTWAASAGDLQGVGRRMTTFFAKTMVLVVGCGVAMAAGAVAWMLAGKSAPALVFTTAGVLLVETAALVPLMVAAFRRLETSTDTGL